MSLVPWVRRARCRITGSGKTLKVRTLGCAQSSFPPTDPRPSSLRPHRRTRRTCNTERHEIYTGSGHRCGVIPYSGVWWWIASWANDEQYKGKNSLLRLRCSCAWCVDKDWLQIRSSQDAIKLRCDAPTVVASSTYIGPGPLPKY